MKIDHCLRCNSSKLEKGIIFDYAYHRGRGSEPMKVHWKIAPHIRGESAPIEAIVCKTCGHIELMIQNYSFIDPHQYQCPHCRAIYYYRLDAEDNEYIVECQNCGENFEVEDPRESEDMLDEIEEDL